MNETAQKVGRVECTKISEILGRIGDKWTVLIVMELRTHKLRFNEIKRAVEGISQQMLTRTLRALERDGMVERTIYLTVPVQVEYELTPLGHSLSKPVIHIGNWARANLPEIERHRQKHDTKKNGG